MMSDARCTLWPPLEGEPMGAEFAIPLAAWIQEYAQPLITQAKYQLLDHGAPDHMSDIRASLSSAEVLARRSYVPDQSFIVASVEGRHLWAGWVDYSIVVDHNGYLHLQPGAGARVKE